MLASIGTVGDAYDNALAESFVDSFKTELIRDRVWQTRTQLALILYCGRLHDDIESLEDEAARRAGLLLDILTPIAKSWPSQWCLEANSLAIQIHGGYGYSREYDVEQHYRDNRLNPIHEGTHGIQALDLLGRKVMMQDGAAFRLLSEEIRGSVELASGGQAADLAEQLGHVLDRLEKVTAAARRSGDTEAVLANATAYLEASGHIVIAWMWLEQFLATADRPGAFYEGKRQAARFFFRHELPRIAHLLDLVEGLDGTALQMHAEWF